MVFLSSKGIDRLFLGELLPSPQTQGRIISRIANIRTSAGIQINDLKGNERSGYAFNEGVGINLGLDYASGREATSLGVNDGGQYTYVSQNSPRSAFERNIMYTDDTISWLKLKNWNSSSIMRLQAIDSTPVKLVRVDTDIKTKSSKTNEVVLKLKPVQE